MTEHRETIQGYLLRETEKAMLLSSDPFDGVEVWIPHRLMENTFTWDENILRTDVPLWFIDKNPDLHEFLI